MTNLCFRSNPANDASTFERICQDITMQNRYLIERVSMQDFNPGVELDNSRNGAMYKITDFFAAIQLFEYGRVPTELSDEMVETTDSLIEAIRKRYGRYNNIDSLCVIVGQVFRRSKRIWRIKDPPVSISHEAFVLQLEESCRNILDKLDGLNAALDTLPATLRIHSVGASPREERLLNERLLADKMREAAFGLLALPDKDRPALQRKYATGKYWAEATGIRPNTIGTLVDLKGTLAKKSLRPAEMPQLYFQICSRNDMFMLFEEIEKNKSRPRVNMKLEEHYRLFTNELEQRLKNNR